MKNLCRRTMMKLDTTRIGPSNYNVKTLQLKIPVFLLYLLNLLSQHESEIEPTRRLLERLLKRTLLTYLLTSRPRVLNVWTLLLLCFGVYKYVNKHV